MGNVIWITVLLLLGTWLLVLGIGHIATGAVAYGMLQIAIGAFNYFVAVLKLTL